MLKRTKTHQIKAPRSHSIFASGVDGQKSSTDSISLGVNELLERSVRMLCERTRSPLLKTLFKPHRHKKSMEMMIRHLEKLHGFSEQELSRYLGADHGKELISNKQLIQMILNGYHQERSYKLPLIRLNY